MSLSLRLMCISMGFALLCPSTTVMAQTMEEALVTAYQSNPGIQAARARLRAVDERVAEAESNWRPSVDATTYVGKSMYDIPDGAASSAAHISQTPRGAGIQVKQPLFRGFRTEAGIRVAENQVLAARAQMQNVEQQLLLHTAGAYLDVVHDQAVIELHQNNEKILSQQLKQVRDHHKAGLLTQTDVSQAEARLERAHAALIQSEGRLSNAQVTYTRLVGVMPGKLTQPVLTYDASKKNIEELARMAEIRNPAVMVAEYTKEEADSNVDLNRGNLLPEVNLVGGVSRDWAPNNFISGRQDNAQVMVQVTIPLYRSGADYARTRAAQQTVTQRRLELEDIRRQARENAVTAWQSLQTAKAALNADEAAIKASTVALKGVKEEYKAGTRTTIDVLDAEQELLDAKVHQVETRHDHDLAILQIKAAIGELTVAALGLKTNLYDPKQHYDGVKSKWVGLEALAD